MPTVVTPELERLMAEGAPVRLGMAFKLGLTPEAAATATIHVERINRPVLLTRELGHQLRPASSPRPVRAYDRLVRSAAGATVDYDGDPGLDRRADAWRHTRGSSSPNGRVGAR